MAETQKIASKKFVGRLKNLFIPSVKNGYRPQFLDSSFLFYYFLILFVLKAAGTIFWLEFPQTNLFAEISKSVIIELTNKTRQSAGLALLKENSLLNGAAALKAQDMIVKDYFSHQSPTGVLPWYWFKKAGYNYQTAGENLGIGFLDSEEIYQAWENSVSHKANLLNPAYRDTGIAILEGDFNGNRVAVVVQLFGSERAAVQQLTAKETDKTIPSSITEQKANQITVKSSESSVLGESSTTTAVVAIQNQKSSPTAGSLTVVKGDSQSQSLKLRFWRFIIADYNSILQKILFVSLIILVLVLLLNVFIRFEIQHPDLIFKNLFFLCFVLLFILLSKTEILSLVPHTFNIY